MIRDDNTFTIGVVLLGEGGRGMWLRRRERERCCSRHHRLGEVAYVRVGDIGGVLGEET